MSTKEYLSVFKSISHPHFDSKTFRPIFIKAAWKAYTDIEHTPISQSRFQNIIGSLFDTLFLDKNQKVENSLHAIRELLVDQNRIEHFFSDTFYIVLNQYIKSFYGKIGGWEKIASFAFAIEQFIAYMAERLEDESFFIFEDALINALEILRQHSQSITVLNTYYGVPIQYPAQIIHTDTQSVILRVHPLQETAALLQNGIYLLKNTHFTYDVYASVHPVILKGERFLELSRFDQLKTSLFHRQSIRVHPHEPYKFTIIHPSLTLQTQAYDISIGGIAVTSKHFYSLSPFVDVILLFPSEIMGQTSEVQGQLIFKSAYEGGYKYHFKITPTLQQEAELSKYIARREQEIIKKLRDEII
ncbi:MAG: PilZ domain-containing protein [Sulfuricurvum sp.]|nr:PilZ domain-containing protein [Sulfuricurvum sp.]